MVLDSVAKLSPQSKFSNELRKNEGCTVDSVCSPIPLLPSPRFFLEDVVRRIEVYLTTINLFNLVTLGSDFTVSASVTR